MKSSDVAILDPTEQPCGMPPPPRGMKQGMAGAARRSVGQGVLSLVDQAVVSGTTFATSAIIGRMCVNSKEALCVYALALSVVLFVRGVQNQVVAAPYMIYCHRRQRRKLASYGGSALVHTLILCALAVVVLMLAAVAMSLGAGPANLSSVTWVLAGVMPFLLLRELIRGFTFAHLQFGAAVAIDVMVAALQLGGLLGLGHAGLLSPATVYLMMGAACALASLAWLVAKKPALRFVRAKFAPDFRHNWLFARWTLASFLLGWTAPLLIPWILYGVCGEAATGVMAACSAIVGLAGMFVTGIGNYLTPKAAKVYADGGLNALRRVLWATAALYAVVVGTFCLLLALTGDRLVVLVYGAEYGGTETILLLLALSVLMNTAGITAGNGLWAVERPAANFAADGCALVVTLVASLVLVYPFGVLGAAVATLLGAATSAAVRCMTLARCLVSARGDAGRIT